MENFKEEMTILMTFERGREKERREISREWCGNQKMRCRWLKFVVRPHFMTVAFWFIVLKSRLLFSFFFNNENYDFFSLSTGNPSCSNIKKRNQTTWNNSEASCFCLHKIQLAFFFFLIKLIYRKSHALNKLILFIQ
jgi:hypothetical protein